MSSGSHVDLMGVSTGVTIEPLTHDVFSSPFEATPSLPPNNTSPLKYWLVVSMKDCTKEEIAREMRRFAHMELAHL